MHLGYKEHPRSVIWWYTAVACGLLAAVAALRIPPINLAPGLLTGVLILRCSEPSQTVEPSPRRPHGIESKLYITRMSILGLGVVIVMVVMRYGSAWGTYPVVAGLVVSAVCGIVEWRTCHIWGYIMNPATRVSGVRSAATLLLRQCVLAVMIYFLVWDGQWRDCTGGEWAVAVCVGTVLMVVTVSSYIYDSTSVPVTRDETGVDACSRTVGWGYVATAHARGTNVILGMAAAACAAMRVEEEGTPRAWACLSIGMGCVALVEATLSHLGAGDVYAALNALVLPAAVPGLSRAIRDAVDHTTMVNVWCSHVLVAVGLRLLVPRWRSTLIMRTEKVVVTTVPGTYVIDDDAEDVEGGGGGKHGVGAMVPAAEDGVSMTTRLINTDPSAGGTAAVVDTGARS